jgi:hypothetical protein
LQELILSLQRKATRCNAKQGKAMQGSAKQSSAIKRNASFNSNREQKWQYKLQT